MQNKMVGASCKGFYICSRRPSPFFRPMIQTTACVWNTTLCSANMITQCVLLPWVQKAASRNQGPFRFDFFFELFIPLIFVVVVVFLPGWFSFPNHDTCPFQTATHENMQEMQLGYTKPIWVLQRVAVLEQTLCYTAWTKMNKYYCKYLILQHKMWWIARRRQKTRKKETKKRRDKRKDEKNQLLLNLDI